MTLLDRRIIIVTGKGGVGKTTVCAALGMDSAMHGRRTLIAETAGCRHLPEVFGVDSKGYLPVKLAENLWTLSITSTAAIEDYVVQQVKFRKLYKLVFRNRVMEPFLSAVPGLHDLVQLGKVFDEERATDDEGHPSWDQIIVDAPATGHGAMMLSSPSTMMALTRTGPLYEGARQVHDVMADPSTTGILLVCLPAEMPVNETLELVQRLGPRASQVGAVVLNETVEPPPASPADWAAARPFLARQGDLDTARAMAHADLWMSRADQQHQAQVVLQDNLAVPIVPLALQPSWALAPSTLSRMGRKLGARIRARTHTTRAP